MYPTFCRDIRLAALSPGALHLFQSRLKASSYTLNIRLDLPGPNLRVVHPGRFRSDICVAVRRNLYRTRMLDVDLPTTVDGDIMSALEHPAPVLRTLEIDFDYAQGSPCCIYSVVAFGLRLRRA